MKKTLAMLMAVLVMSALTVPAYAHGGGHHRNTATTAQSQPCTVDHTHNENCPQYATPANTGYQHCR